MIEIFRNRCAAWVRNYSDLAPCIELMAMFDDTLKKNETFLNYAVLVANRIIEDLGIETVIATRGKWGARLETSINKKASEDELELLAIRITEHPSWLALKLSTQVFTYGKQWVCETQ